MDFQSTPISMPVAALIASLIGATATISAALIQLRIAWRKELQAREKRQPVTQKARRGPVTAVIVLLVASAIGGFALSQYLASEGKKEAAQMQAELTARLDQLNRSAQRLEQASLTTPTELEAKARQAVAQRLGDEGVTAAVGLAPCDSCTEQQAQQVSLCTDIPATATVLEVMRYSRNNDDSGAWLVMEHDQTLGTGRFVGNAYERLDSETSKQVCQEYWHWDTEHARSLRIRVRYSLHSPATPTP